MESPLDYEVDIPRRCVRVIYKRQPTIDEWIAAMNTIFGDPRRKNNFGMILDRLEVPHPANTPYIERMVDFIDSKNGGNERVPWAIVVTDLASFGMGRMAEQLTTTEAIRTFRDLNEAQQWLDEVEEPR
jgi:hypothetical protein